jgi:hypothetical protein
VVEPARWVTFTSIIGWIDIVTRVGQTVWAQLIVLLHLPVAFLVDTVTLWWRCGGKVPYAKIIIRIDGRITIWMLSCDATTDFRIPHVGFRAFTWFIRFISDIRFVTRVG